MKNYIKFSFLFFAFSVTTSLFAQDAPAATSRPAATEKKATTNNIETASFKVSGNCGMCKRRIEESCVIKGVKAATWNNDTELLTIKFDTKRTSLEKIKKQIAKSGHDVEGAPADNAAYDKLPGCCQYRAETKVKH